MTDHPQSPRRYWRTKAGIVVIELARSWFDNRHNIRELKILAYRAATMAPHGWLWLKPLRRVSAADYRAEVKKHHQARHDAFVKARSATND